MASTVFDGYGEKSFYVERDLNRNAFEITEGKEKNKVQTSLHTTASPRQRSAKDTVGREVGIIREERMILFFSCHSQSSRRQPVPAHDVS